VPIVALTASVFAEEREQIFAAGCDDMLRKPVEAEALFEVLGRLLGLKFEYDEGSDTQYDADNPNDTGLTFNALPNELRQKLKEAAITLDVEACQSIAEKLRGDYPAEANFLSSLIESYNFDSLVALCK